MTDKFEEKILELNSIEERMKSTPVYNIDRKYMNTLFIVVSWAKAMVVVVVAIGRSF